MTECSRVYYIIDNIVGTILSMTISLIFISHYFYSYSVKLSIVRVSCGLCAKNHISISEFPCSHCIAVMAITH